MGAGWATPYNIVVASKDQPDHERLAAALGRPLPDPDRARPAVVSVVGPGALVAATKDLKKLPKSLNDSKKLLKGGKKDLGRLATGLGQAGAGATQLRAGLGDAASGAGQLQSGGSAAASGAGKLHAGLAQARAGAAKITAGLTAALNGATALKKGATAALAGSRKLAGGLGTGSKTVKAGLPAFKQLADTTGAVAGDLGQAKTSASGVTGQLDAAIAKLSAMTTGKDDPAYAAAMGELTQARSSAAGLGTHARRPRAQGRHGRDARRRDLQPGHAAERRPQPAERRLDRAGLGHRPAAERQQPARGGHRQARRRRQAADQRPERPDRRRGRAGSRSRPAHQRCRPARDRPERRHRPDRQADQRPGRHAGQGPQVRRIAAFGQGPREAPARRAGPLRLRLLRAGRRGGRSRRRARAGHLHHQPAARRHRRPDRGGAQAVAGRPGHARPRRPPPQHVGRLRRTDRTRRSPSAARRATSRTSPR